MDSKTVDELKIIEQVKLKLVDKYSTEILYYETWPNLFIDAIKIYNEIAPSTHFKKSTILIPILIRVIDDVSKIETLKMDDDTRTLLTRTLKPSMVSIIQLLYEIPTDLRCVNTEIKVKYEDKISHVLELHIKKEMNISAINKSTWPYMVAKSIEFLSTASSPIDIDRQQKILDETLPQLLYSAATMGTKDVTVERFRTCLRPFITAFYSAKWPLDYTTDDDVKINKSKSKCCCF